MSALGYIPHDGYTEEGYIAAAPRLHPALHFKFRPALLADRVDYVTAAEKLKGWKARQYEAALLARKLVDWSLCDGRGQPVAVNEGNLLRLKAKLFDRLFNVVMGEQAPDEDPAGAERRADDADGESLLEAVRKGVPVAQARAEADAKNS